VKSTIEVASPPAKALMIYDGDCNFCSLWVHRWQHAIGEHLDYLPFQDPRVASRFPEVPRGQLETAVQLIETDGRVYGGAEAVFRALAHKPHGDWLLGWYERSSVFARVTEWGYRLVARHRSFFSACSPGRRVIKPCAPFDKTRGRGDV
jgi:predicted DCC family thiol-disulfide oxidoreductase YuxK